MRRERDTNENMTVAEIFILLFCIIGLIENLLIIFVILADRTLRKNLANQFFVNLMVWYFLFDLASLLRSVVSSMGMNVVDLLITTIIASSLAISALTLDRMLAIKFPYRHHSLPRWVPCLVIIFCWAIPIAYLILSFVLEDEIKDFTRGCIFVTTNITAIVCLVVSNTIIFVEARMQLKKIEKTQVRTTSPKDEQFSSNALQSKSKTVSANKVKSETRLAYICFGVVITYIIFWLPMTLEYLINGLQRQRPSEATRVLVYLNAIVMPVFYAWFNKSVKKSLKSRMCRIHSTTSHSDESYVSSSRGSEGTKM